MAEKNVDGQATLGKIETDDGVSKEKYALAVEATIDKPADPVDVELDSGDSKKPTILAETTTDGLMGQQNVEHEIKAGTDASVEAEGTIVRTVVMQHSGAHLMKSTKTSAPILKSKVRSRYLIASPGSCHDFCKYGHKNDVEEKARVPLWRTIREGRELAKAQLAEKSEKKMSVARRLSFPGTKAEKDNALALQETEDAEEPKLEPLDSRKISSSLRRPAQSTRSGNNVVNCNKKTGALPVDSSTSYNQAVKEIKGNNNVGNHTKGKERSMGTVRPAVSPKPSMRKAASMNVKRYGNLKDYSDTKNETASQETKVTQPDDVPEKTLYVIEPTGDQKTRESPQFTGEIRKVRRVERGSSVIKSKGYRSSSQKRNYTSSHSSSLSTSPIPSKSTLSSIQEPSQSGQEEQGRPGSTRSRQSDGSSKEQGRPGSTRNRQSDASSESGKSRSIYPRAKPSVGQKTLKAKRVVPSQSSGDKDVSIWKMKFRRGAVITLPAASSSPRRLKFKRERVVSGNSQNVNTAASGRRRLNDNDVAGNGSATTKAQLEKVTLRHQEAGEKKDNVNLNYMIEETAGKLVQTRKSKVKALVGAFESVMSLRERKLMVAPSASC